MGRTGPSSSTTTPPPPTPGRPVCCPHSPGAPSGFLDQVLATFSPLLWAFLQTGQNGCLAFHGWPPLPPLGLYICPVPGSCVLSDSPRCGTGLPLRGAQQQPPRTTLPCASATATLPQVAERRGMPHSGRCRGSHWDQWPGLHAPAPAQVSMLPPPPPPLCLPAPRPAGHTWFSRDTPPLSSECPLHGTHPPVG